MRRRSARPKEHVILFRVASDDWTMIRLKASVYCRGNVSAFLREAVAAYGRTLPAINCLQCQTRLDYRFEGTINWGPVTVTNVPLLTCPKCGDKSYDMTVMERLDEAMQGRSGHFDFCHLTGGSGPSSGEGD
jgi:hypothetical protein